MSIVGLIGSYCLWTAVTFDEHAEDYIEGDINHLIHAHRYQELRKISNAAAYKWLKKTNHVKLTFATDDQGSGNLGYYAAKINGRYDFFVTFKVKSLIPSRFSLIRITYYPSYHQHWFNLLNKKAPAANRPQSAKKSTKKLI